MKRFDELDRQEKKILHRDSKNHRSSRFAFFAVCTASIICIVAVFVVLFLPSRPIQSPATSVPMLPQTPASNSNDAFADAIEMNIAKTRESLAPYLALIGTPFGDGNISVSNEFSNGAQHVFVMGKEGTVSHHSSAGSEDTITVMKWIDNTASTQKEFEYFVRTMSIYFHDDAQKKSFNSISNETYWWDDDLNHYWIYLWHEDSHIHLEWYRPTDESDSPSDSIDEFIAKTRESLAPYLALIGTPFEDGNVSVSYEFSSGVNNVFIMGRKGTVSHLSTVGSKGTITAMKWVDNSTCTQEEFEQFIRTINIFYGEDSQKRSFDNMSEKTYCWSDIHNNCWIYLWNEDSRIYLEWYRPLS